MSTELCAVYCIEDRKIATAYAIEALLVFDPAWFETYYKAGSQKMKDRQLFVG